MAYLIGLEEVDTTCKVIKTVNNNNLKVSQGGECLHKQPLSKCVLIRLQAIACVQTGQFTICCELSAPDWVVLSPGDESYNSRVYLVRLLSGFYLPAQLIFYLRYSAAEEIMYQPVGWQIRNQCLNFFYVIYADLRAITRIINMPFKSLTLNKTVKIKYRQICKLPISAISFYLCYCEQNISMKILLAIWKSLYPWNQT